jgi:hypothetical protein
MLRPHIAHSNPSPTDIRPYRRVIGLRPGQVPGSRTRSSGEMKIWSIRSAGL